MQDTRTSTAASARLARWSTIFAIVALLIAACSNPPAAPSSAAPAASAPASVAPASSAPASAAAKFKIGYISLGDSVPFVKLVSDGIKEAASAAGQELLFCDSEIDAAKALACARNLKVQGAQGVLNFQVFQDSSPEICAAYGSVPTIAIDIIQPPCQIAFMGANNREAGRLGGAEMGKYAKANWDCDFTAYVSLESTAAGAANTDRMGGWRDGFKESCPIPADKERILDGADRTDPA
ncbi:MAG: sugar ABC transporter substrate-binding protein, partial [Candidatus Limnocylindrales bacterium]